MLVDVSPSYSTHLGEKSFTQFEFKRPKKKKNQKTTPHSYLG